MSARSQRRRCSLSSHHHRVLHHIPTRSFVRRRSYLNPPAESLPSPSTSVENPHPTPKAAIPFRHPMDRTTFSQQSQAAAAPPSTATSPDRQFSDTSSLSHPHPLAPNPPGLHVLRPLSNSLIKARFTDTSGRSEARYLPPSPAEPLPPHHPNELDGFTWVNLDHRRSSLGTRFVEHLNSSVPREFHRLLDDNKFHNPNVTGNPYKAPPNMIQQHMSAFSSIQDMMTDLYPLPLSTSSEPFRAKNRYTSVLPHDHSRVLLGPDHPNRADPADLYSVPYSQLSQQQLLSTYFNGSDVLPPVGFPSQYSYIACQAPKPTSIDDIWNMIWHHHVELIVMLTPLAADKACPYWPGGVNTAIAPSGLGAYTMTTAGTTAPGGGLPLSRAPTTSRPAEGFSTPLPSAALQPNRQYTEPESGCTQTYADCYKVTVQNIVTETEFVVRQFLIQYLGDTSDPHGLHPSHQRNVNLLQYNAWPDHGTPSRTSFLYMFMAYRVLRSQIKLINSPILVHCSAGVGRTGTFITIDMMLDYMRETMLQGQIPSLAKVSEVVASLRTSRLRMVDRSAQYAWIYKFLQFSFWHPFRKHLGLPIPPPAPAGDLLPKYSIGR